MLSRQIFRRLAIPSPPLIVGALLVLVLASAVVVEDVAVRQFFPDGRAAPFQPTRPDTGERADLVVRLAGQTTSSQAVLPRLASTSTRYELQRVAIPSDTSAPLISLRVDVCNPDWSSCKRRAVADEFAGENLAFSLPAGGTTTAAYLRLTLTTRDADVEQGRTVRIAWRAVAE